MMVPRADYRTAIAITHDQGMREVTTTFLLQEQKAGVATYSAPCPRCKQGEIIVDVRLNPDRSFAESPACPSLCLACEDLLDAILEPRSGKAPGKEEEGGRETLGRHLKAMNTRSWD